MRLVNSASASGVVCCGAKISFDGSKISQADPISDLKWLKRIENILSCILFEDYLTCKPCREETEGDIDSVCGTFLSLYSRVRRL